MRACGELYFACVAGQTSTSITIRCDVKTTRLSSPLLILSFTLLVACCSAYQYVVTFCRVLSHAWHQVLGLEKGCTADEIKKAYRYSAPPRHRLCVCRLLQPVQHASFMHAAYCFRCSTDDHTSSSQQKL